MFIEYLKIFNIEREINEVWIDNYVCTPRSQELVPAIFLVDEQLSFFKGPLIPICKSQ